MWKWLRRAVSRSPTGPNAASLGRYQELRATSLKLSDRLVETLVRKDIDEAGHKLGMLRKNELSIGDENELPVLMDYCLHHVRRKGQTPIDRFLASSPPASPDELLVLKALQKSKFTLLVVEKSDPGVGASYRDLLRGESGFLFDVGLGNTARAGLVLACHVFCPEDLYMTTGTALPIAVLKSDELERFRGGVRAAHRGFDFAHLTPQQDAEFAANVIRTCLRQGAAGRIAYVDPEVSTELTGGAPRPKPGWTKRNALCPCGSGKKYKDCCGRRPRRK